MADRIAAILRQMLQAVGWIAADIAGLDLTSFVGDRRARQLVERNLEILSGASRRIPPDLRASEHGVDWIALASLGNVLRHEYQRVDPVLLWTLLTDELPALTDALRRLEGRIAAGGAEPGSPATP